MKIIQVITKFIISLLSGTFERISPSDIIPRESIHIINNPSGVLINLAKLNIPFTQPPVIWTPHVPDTNSMDGLLDFGHNTILIGANNPIGASNPIDQKILCDFVKVGDIVVYRIPPDFSQPAKIYALHRIIKIGSDSQGRWFKAKGDNNKVADPYAFRDINLLYLVVAIIY